MHGYFHLEQFEHRDGPHAISEIALNPRSFGRTVEEVLSTLVHEMVHAWQYRFGSSALQLNETPH